MMIRSSGEKAIDAPSVILGLLLTSLTLSPPASAFHDPVDSSGPLTLRIEGPAELTKPDTPVAVRAVLENTGDKPLRGHVRLGVTDHWRADPSDKKAFALDARSKITVDFTVTPGQGTYAALYPIHAFAESEGADRRIELHAVLIVESKLPNPPRAMTPLAWKPLTLPPDSGLRLGRLGVRRVIIQVRGEKPLVMPTGWSGTEPGTLCAVYPGENVTRGAARDAIAMHPPYLNGRAGTVLVEYPLRLPAGKPIRLTFGNAIRDTRPEAGETPSDGVTFRVRVLALDAPEGTQGDVLYETTTTSKTWLEGQVDLAAFAGREVRVQLESHPGPKNNTNCDQSYWADPTVIAGTLPQPAAFPPPQDAPSRLIGRIPFGDAQCEVRVWPGKRGMLDGTVGFIAGEKRLLFRGFHVRVFGDLLSEITSTNALVAATEESSENLFRIRHQFAGAMGTFDVVSELRVESGVLRASFRLENAPPAQPWLVARLDDVAAGPWSQQAQSVYAGQGNVMVEPDAFTLWFDGHRLSTSFVGFDFGDMKIVHAVNKPPDHLEVDPKSRMYTLHTPHDPTMTFIPATDVWAAAAKWREVNGLRAGGGVQKLAGRFVFDLWGGRYADLTASLQRAFRYGLTDAGVIMHNWQRWGYDYRLPDIYPPNPAYGTFEEFRALVEACRKAGVLFAPHDNYIDYYPDAEGYSYEHIAFHSGGEPIKAWFNPGPKSQSYRWRAQDTWTPLKSNVQLIRAGFAPTAYFIDVWSSIGPYDEWSWDGRFTNRVDVARTWGEAFAWIRDQLGDNAPQISESGHDQLIGWLDGAQTNHLRVVQPAEAGQTKWMAWPVPCKDAERIPWFDAAHHDRFIHHGAGYPGRYEGGLDSKTHGIYSDDYICTEVLTGHPAMVPHAFGRDVVRKYWLTHELARALALKAMRGAAFVDGDIHRQHVTWEGDGEVYVNRGKTDWTIANHVLPPYGFYAVVKTPDGVVSAAIERQGAGTVEWSSSPRSIYVNAGPDAGGQAATVTCGPASASGACRIDVQDATLRVTPLPDSGTFVVRLNWDKLPWKLPRPTSADVIDEQGKTVRKAAIAWQGDACELTCEPGVFAYRFTGRE